ncbi:MAG TPA: hypothetical protein VKN99_04205 [Polyangia bacterium]|nr:hypothetical protein [Polyangia bacterium]
MLRTVRPLFDLVAIGLMALAFLFPRPGVIVHPALARAGVHTLDRIAELQAHLVGHPDDVDSALELADLYVWQWRPDWGLATLGPLAERHPDDFRIQFAIAVAHADRFDFAAAKTSIDRGQEVCRKNAGTVPCGEPDMVRMSVFERAVGDVVAQHVNPAQDPNRVKQILDSALHNAKIPQPGSPWVPPPRKPPTPAPAQRQGK